MREPPPRRARPIIARGSASGCPTAAALGQVVLLLVPVLILAWMGWRQRWTADDGFINLRIVRQLLAGNGPVFNAGDRVEAGTSPAWIVLLAALDVVLPLRLEWIALFAGLGATLGGLAFAIFGTRGRARGRAARTRRIRPARRARLRGGPAGVGLRHVGARDGSLDPVARRDMVVPVPAGRGHRTRRRTAGRRGRRRGRARTARPSGLPGLHGVLRDRVADDVSRDAPGSSSRCSSRRSPSRCSWSCSAWRTSRASCRTPPSRRRRHAATGARGGGTSRTSPAGSACTCPSRCSSSCSWSHSVPGGHRRRGRSVGSPCSSSAPRSCRPST